MKINPRDKNCKRSRIANKDESSAKTASLKCTIFINKRQEKAFAEHKTLCACVKEGDKERERELFPT